MILSEAYLTGQGDPGQNIFYVNSSLALDSFVGLALMNSNYPKDRVTNIVFHVAAQTFFRRSLE